MRRRGSACCRESTKRVPRIFAFFYDCVRMRVHAWARWRIPLPGASTVGGTQLLASPRAPLAALLQVLVLAVGPSLSTAAWINFSLNDPSEDYVVSTVWARLGLLVGACCRGVGGWVQVSLLATGWAARTPPPSFPSPAPLVGTLPLKCRSLYSQAHAVVVWM